MSKMKILKRIWRCRKNHYDSQGRSRERCNWARHGAKLLVLQLPNPNHSLISNHIIPNYLRKKLNK